MLSRLPRIAAPCAALALSACAGGSDALRREVEALRSEVLAVQRQGDATARRLDVLSQRVEAMAERPRQAPAAPAATTAPEVAPAEARPLVPPDLQVVRVAPPKAGRAPPPISTSVAVVEPDPERLERVSRPPGSEIAAEAEGELAGARRRTGLDRAHALEAFVARYPRHPSADNALVEAAREYAAAGRAQATCELARRVLEDYPAGDAVSAAQELAARCERSRP